jgi:hypothetical protein
MAFVVAKSPAAAAAARPRPDPDDDAGEMIKTDQAPAARLPDSGEDIDAA